MIGAMCLLRGEKSVLVPQGKSQGQEGVSPAGHNIARLVMCHIAQVIVFHKSEGLEHLLWYKVGCPEGNWVCPQTPVSNQLFLPSSAEGVDGEAVCGSFLLLELKDQLEVPQVKAFCKVRNWHFVTVEM